MLAETDAALFVDEVARVGKDTVYWVRREAAYALGALAKVVPFELIDSVLVSNLTSCRKTIKSKFTRASYLVIIIQFVHNRRNMARPTFSTLCPPWPPQSHETHRTSIDGLVPNQGFSPR